MRKRFAVTLIALCMTLTLLPTTVEAALRNNGVKLEEGWYNLRCMGNYLNLDANGNVELRDKTNTVQGNAKFYARFDGELLLETEDGKYLGLDTRKMSNGLRVKAVENTSVNLVRWDIYNEDKSTKDIWSLRPRMEIDYVLNASGQKNANGTQIIIWEHIDKWRCPSEPIPDSPEHAEIRFIPTTPPNGATVPGTPKTPADGWYSLRFDVEEVNNIVDVIRADLVQLNSWSCAMQWTRAFYVENKGDNTMTLRVADGRYIGTVPDKYYGYIVSAVDKPFLWKARSYSPGLTNNQGKYTLSPATDTDLYFQVHAGNFSLGGMFPVRGGLPGSKSTTIVFWELSGDDIPKTSGWAPPKVTASPSNTNFVMNGKPVSVTAAYTINSTNYLQLRAIAAMLSGTAAQFDVDWDGQYAVIEPGKPYSGAVTQTKLQNTTNIRQSGTKFKLNGEVFTFSDARLIDGDTNYLQLREFAQKLSGTESQFNVYWDGASGQAVIQPGMAYTGSAA